MRVCVCARMCMYAVFFFFIKTSFLISEKFLTSTCIVQKFYSNTRIKELKIIAAIVFIDDMIKKLINAGFGLC